jgi:hypothetical protein
MSLAIVDEIIRIWVATTQYELSYKVLGKFCRYSSNSETRTGFLFGKGICFITIA